ncbi:hypothetical protein [Pseudodesulfovibrio indicus]|uniref:hypothetical protein n=1 Tax=Pseudodesulfovibrio indicus TaxID=1716143 RepID=UPI00292D051A|nr:hypothetical protein [Pseudodesulfovibrio indicus]
MATITKRGKHQWQAKVRRKGYPAQSKTFDRKIDAEQWARNNENKTDRGLIELAALSHAAQDCFLSGILGKGIPIPYRDDQGELVKELPGGKTERIMGAS